MYFILKGISLERIALELKEIALELKEIAH